MKEEKGLEMEGVEGEGSGSGSGLVTQSEGEKALVKEEKSASPVRLSPPVRIKAEERDEEMVEPLLPLPPPRPLPPVQVKTEKMEEAKWPTTIFLSDDDEDDEL